MIAKIKPANMKIFLKMVFYYNLSIYAYLRLLQRQNMTKMRNQIPANISDFTVWAIA
jgi:hypothetical protein